MSGSVPRPSGRHGLVLRLLHWLTVALVFVQLTLAGLNAWLYEPRPVIAEALVQAHISCCAVLLALTITRIAVRIFGHSAKPSLSSLPAVAGAVQLCLYSCLLALPVSGYIQLAAIGFPISLFGVVTLPSMLSAPELALKAAAAHNTIAIVLMGAILTHVAGALLHRRRTGESAMHRIGFGPSR
ncbi:MAG: cytochrome b/b6 domain-containing protein [Pseudomonadota bacterium]